MMTPAHCHILSCAGGKPQWGYFYREFQGYKTGRRGSRIVKVTQSAAKVVTGVSVSLSCAAVRHKIKMWITEHLLHVTQREACCLFYKVTRHPERLLSCDIIIQRDVLVHFNVTGFGDW